MKKEKKREKNLVSVMMIRTIPGAGTIGTKYSYSDYFWRIKANKEAGKRLIKCYPWTGIEKLLIRTWRDNEKFWNSLFKKFFFKFFSCRKKFLFNLIREEEKNFRVENGAICCYFKVIISVTYWSFTFWRVFWKTFLLFSKGKIFLFLFYY